MALGVHSFADYVASLPSGWSSFPTCQVPHAVFDMLDEELAQRGRRRATDMFAAVAGRPVPAQGWVPEIMLNAAFYLVREHFDDDVAFDRFNHEAAMSLYRKPLYRALMTVMSPTLIIMGMGKRWTAFRRGTELAVKHWKQGDTHQVEAVLTHPAGLHTEESLGLLRVNLVVALQAARARRAAVRLTGHGPGEARYELSYT